MSDYYKILGVNKNANPEEIKKAYRSLAMKHHPDRGGDANKFKEIEEAYRTLSDDQKRAEYDNPQQAYNSTINEEIFEQFFRNPFGGFSSGFRSARNPNVNVTVDVTLEDAFNGKTIDAEIGLSNGSTKLISIQVPPGIDTGMQIKYNGMGETLNPRLPPGDLIVTVRVLNHSIWKREGNNLIYEKSISVWDALLGTSLTLVTIDGRTITITIPAGTQPDSILSCKGEGMPHVRSKAKGNLLIRIKVSIPKDLTTSDISKIKQLRNELSIRTS